MSVLPAVTPGDELPDVFTGELIPRTDTPRLARYLDKLREHRAQLAEVVRLVEQEIVEESRRAGSKTLRWDGVEAKVTGGQRLTWDQEVLRELLEAGLPEDRWAELVTTEVTYRVNTLVAKSIEASGNERYREIVQRARGYVDAPQRVQVKVAP